MGLISILEDRWKGLDYPFLIHENGEVRFDEVTRQVPVDLTEIKSGDVVALVGDFDPASILTLLLLIDKQAILVPLTIETKPDHPYFLETAMVDVVIEGSSVQRITHNKNHVLFDLLRAQRRPGLVLFSTGTTGRPKAILHDLSLFLKRFETVRPTLKTISFLLFDHIGGLNTLLHTLFNKGTIVAPSSRGVNEILATCKKYNVEVLPTTPTFLRMMLLSGLIPQEMPPNLKIITYGTERMDQPTLDALCDLLPSVEFRQTFGMSELGIVRAKSEARDSLFMKIGGEGIETRVVDNVLEIRSTSRMLGYLNADSAFDSEGWYNTKDIVEQKNEFYKIVGRTSDVVNVGGLKFMASEVERAALEFPGVSLVKVIPKVNPITGQHVELSVQPIFPEDFDKNALMAFLQDELQPHMVPKRIRIQNVPVGHRYKKS